MKIILTLTFLLVVNLLLGQRGNLDRPPAQPGKCYAKVMIADRIEKSELAYTIYTGDQPESVRLDTR